MVITFSSHLCTYFLLTLLIATENGNVAKAQPQAQSWVDTPSGPICQASIKEMSKAMMTRARVRTKTRTRTRTRTEDVHKMVHHSWNAKTFRHVISVYVNHLRGTRAILQ